MPRAYESSHSFLDFRKPDLDACWDTWLALGEAFSKCEHLAGAPLPPAVAAELSSVYMVKGAHATTAIEGNTLSEDEVKRIAAGERTQPPSREYLEVEVQNVLRALRGIDDAVKAGRELPFTRERLCELNETVLINTEHEPEAIPGAFRSHALSVPSYTAVPAEDVDYLVDRLLDWVDTMTNTQGLTPQEAFVQAVVTAIIAHMYLAWIHPFGDGNGRTARLVEAQILAYVGHLPLPSINLLSDHYNKTRTRYFHMFNEARGRRDLRPFIRYAVEGFRDGVREQVDMIRELFFQTAWRSYVFEVMGTQKSGPARERRRELVLSLPRNTEVPRAEVTRLTPRLAELYAVKKDKTLTRDLNLLERLNLIVRPGKGTVLANTRVMESYLPPIAIDHNKD